MLLFFEAHFVSAKEVVCLKHIFEDAASNNKPLPTLTRRVQDMMMGNDY